MNALIAAMMLWISANSDLPIVKEVPTVELVSAGQIVSYRYKAFLGARAENISGNEVVSVYDDSSSTIYLPSNWTGSTPADLSVLVHELVHHVQNRAHLKFGCAAEREQMAYELQGKWLALFGRDLEGEFGLDGFSLLVKTKCIY